MTVLGKFSSLLLTFVITLLIITMTKPAHTEAQSQSGNIGLQRMVTTHNATKPIIGTGQNLPALGGKYAYDAGPGFATQITQAYETGLVRRAQQDVTKAAQKWSATWLRQICPTRSKSCKAMAVFDIDDTLLDHYAYYSSQDPAFTWSVSTWDAYEAACQSPTNTSVAELYHKLLAMGMKVTLITGRSEPERSITIDCLTSLGITGWHKLIMRASTEKERDVSAATYKAQARRDLEKQGWKIGPSIGDQLSDMSGGYLSHGFWLPNGMYYLP